MVKTTTLGVSNSMKTEIDSLISNAASLMEAGQFADAIPVWERLLQLGPAHVPHGAYARLASAYRKNGQVDAALDVAERAMRDGKTSEVLHAEIAATLVAEGRADEAIDHLVGAARRTKSETTKRGLLRRATDLEARYGKPSVAVRNMRALIESYENPLDEKELKASAALAAQRLERAQAADGWEAYWRQRKDYVYLHVCRRLIEIIARSATAVADVGSNRSPILNYFGPKQVKYSVDIENPYRGEDVIAVTEDFYTWSPPQDIQVGTCFQVIEHVPDPAKFLRRMLEMFEVSIISVPHLEPAGLNPGHINNDLDLATIEGWAGRSPNFHYVARELSGDERIICVFDRNTEAPYPNMHNEGRTAQEFAYRWSLDDFDAE